MSVVGEVLDEVVHATGRLAASVDGLDPIDLDGSSRLPGWTRGHVLTYLARNADGLRNLLLAARTGEPLKMYASPVTRVADIDAGAARSPEVIIADVLESSRRFIVEARALPTAAWAALVPFSSGQP